MQKKVEAILEVTGANNFMRVFDEAAKGMENFEKRTNDTGNKIEQATSKFKGFADGVGKIATAIGVTKIIGASINAINGALDGAITRVDRMNAFPRVMKLMGFSAEDSEKSVDKLSDGIQGLPTSLDDILASTQNIAILTNDIDGATDTALALNNAFLMSGSGAADANRGLTQYVQMLSRGEVDMQSWRTLQETMGPALMKTAEAFGFAGSAAQNDLYDALQDGSITFEEFDGMLIELSNTTGGFAEMALEASGGIRTSMQNIKTAIVRNVGNAIQAVDDAMTAGGFGSISENLDRVKTVVDNAFKKIVGFIPPVMDAIVNLYNVIKDSTAFNTLVELVNRAKDAIGVFFDNLERSGVLQKVKGFISELAKALLDLNFMEIAREVGEFLKRWSPLIAGVIAGMATFKLLIGVTKGVQLAIQGLSAISHAVKGFKLATQVFGGVKGAMSALIPIFTGVSLPILGIVAAIVAVVAIGVVMWKNWDVIKEKAIELGDKLKEVWEGIKSSISNAIQAAGDFVRSVFGSLSDWWTETNERMSAMVKSIWDGIANFFTGLWEGISNGVTSAWNGIKDFMFNVWASIVDGVKTFFEPIGKFISSVWDGIKNVTGIVWGVIKNVLLVIIGAIYLGASAVFNLLKDSIMNIWNVISTITSTVWNAISGYLSEVVTVIWERITSVFNSVKDVLTGIWDAIATKVSEVWNGIVAFFGPILQSISDLITQKWEVIRNVTSEVWDAIVTFISGVWESISNKVSEVFTAISNVISEVWEAVSTATKNVWEAIKNKIKGTIDVILEVVTGWINAVKNVIVAVWNVISTVTSNVWNGIKNAISTIINTIKVVIENVINTIKNVISNVWNQVSTVTSNVWNSIKNTISNVLNNIKSTFSNIFNGLKNIVSTAFNKVKTAVKSGMDLAWQTVTGYFNKFRDAGANVVQSIADGISGAIGKVTGAISNITQSIRDFLPFSPAKDGALRDLNKLNFGGTISDAIYSSERAIQRAMGSVIQLPEIDSSGLNTKMARVNKQLQSEISYDVNVANNRVQPMELHVKLGDSSYKVFVDDISKAQGRAYGLEEMF